MPRKILSPGDPCRECGNPVSFRTHSTPPKCKPGGYYFEWWLRCPHCKITYFVDAAKKYPDAAPTSAPSIQRIESHQQWFGNAVAAPDFVDNGIPPW